MTALLLDLLRLAGVVQLILAVSHALFAPVLKWKEETARMSPINRQIFWVHTYFVVLMVALFGALSLFYARDLLAGSGPLGRVLLGGLTGFWGFRWYCQFFVYTSETWRGNALRTGVHIVFALVWGFLTLTYGAAFLCAWWL